MNYEELIKQLVESELNSKPKDADKKNCKICGEYKTRILSGMYDSRNKRWRDESGRDWSGRTCPDCHVNKTKDNMKTLRNK